MANSLGPTMDKNEQIARWTTLIEKHQKTLKELESDENPTEEKRKYINNLKRIINEYRMLIKDNQVFLAERDRIMRERYNKFINKK